MTSRIASTLCAVCPALAYAMPFVNSVVQAVMFALVLVMCAFMAAQYFKAAALLNEVRELLKIGKVYHKLATQQSADATRLVQTIPAATRAPVKAAVKEAIHEVQAEDRLSGEHRSASAAEFS